MTVTIETPEGLKTGSAVREVAHQQGLHVTPEMLPNIGFKGEAVVVDLGKYGVLFALLTGAVHSVDYGSDIIFNVLPKEGARTGLDRIPPKGHVVALTPDQYPMFVRFRDMNDPMSLENVTKYDLSVPHDMKYLFDGDKFGEGVKLKEITIEMVDDPVIWGEVEKWLPWLPARSKLPGYIGGSVDKWNDDSSKTFLTAGDFRENGPPDDITARDWLLKEANQGNVEAQDWLGIFYKTGDDLKKYTNREGVVKQKDFVEALKWFQRAADQGDAEAQYYVGEMYYVGEGAKQDYAEALNWLRKAADQGDYRAHDLLSRMYQEGSGVTQNYAEAYFWDGIARISGTGRSIHFKSALAVHLTPDEKAAIDKRIEEWHLPLGPAGTKKEQ